MNKKDLAILLEESFGKANLREIFDYSQRKASIYKNILAIYGVGVSRGYLEKIFLEEIIEELKMLSPKIERDFGVGFSSSEITLPSNLEIYEDFFNSLPHSS